MKSEAHFSLILWLRWGRSPGRTGVCFWIFEEDLDTAIKVATPRMVDWQAERQILIKALLPQLGGWELARSVCWVGEESFQLKCYLQVAERNEGSSPTPGHLQGQ